MEFLVLKGLLEEQTADVLVVNAFEGVKALEGGSGAVDKALDGLLARCLHEEGFKGKLGETLLLRTEGKLKAKRVLLVGLGKKEDFCLEQVRQAAAASAEAARKIGAKKVASVLHGAGVASLDARDCARAIVEGAELAAYTYGRYKKEQKNPIKTFAIVTSDARAVRAAQRGIEEGALGAQATMFARDLVNTPGGHMAPQDLVEAAKQVAKGNKNVRVRVFDKAQLARMGAGGILGVSQGSDHPPYLVHLTYKPKGRVKKNIALVGKAITFDSGGLSLKSAEFMMTMKNDMAGAAAVLGAFRVMDKLAPHAQVHGIFGACENMPSGKAIRPGDIVTAMNKKTIEILNTDAEGRVTLADTLTYATRLKPDLIIDLATLTGACMVALGEEVTGLMGNDPHLSQKVLMAAGQAGEKMWELPLEKAYERELKSDVADYKNIGNSRYGGAITAGLFLREFVGKIPWVHLDMGGAAFAERPFNAYTKKGATGHGTRTLLQFLKSI